MKYDIIYADPPWEYDDKSKAGKRGVEYKYDTMSLEDIKDLPIKEIANDDCVLFIWATFPLLPECLEVINSWGFVYKTLGFVWIKTNSQSGNLFWGMGNWTRANSEVCLLATRGTPKRESKDIHQVIMGPNLEHSYKPPIVAEKIVELCGDKKRIELFARDTCRGWDCIGNEIDGKDIREALQNIIGG